MRQAFPDPFDVAIGKRIRYQRQLRRISQKALGDAVGVSFQQIQKYERGTNRIAASTLVRFASVLRVSPATLLADMDAQPHDGMMTFLDWPSAQEFLQAFSALEGEKLRRALVNLVRALAASAAKDVPAQ